MADESKITRDAFLYLEPQGDAPEDFAQCKTCGFFNPTMERCRALRAEDVVTETMSCGYYREGENTEELPEGWFTPEQVGLVDRKVRCENCGAFDKENNKCFLYEELMKQDPDHWDLNTAVKPHACCNAQHPPDTEKAANPHWKALASYFQKAGARHGLRDRNYLQTAHDAVASLVDGAFCAPVEKAGARHSKTDLERIEQAHDLLVALGAQCPSPQES